MDKFLREIKERQQEKERRAASEAAAAGTASQGDAHGSASSGAGAPMNLQLTPLPPDVTEEDLVDMFAYFGDVCSAHIPRGGERREERGDRVRALICLLGRDAGNEAMRALDRSVINGTEVRVTEHIPHKLACRFAKRSRAPPAPASAADVFRGTRFEKMIRLVGGSKGSALGAPWTDQGRAELRQLLADLTPERGKIADGMLFAILNADHCQEVTDVVLSGIPAEDGSVAATLARVFLVSDILYNSNATARNAFAYRGLLEARLPDTFAKLGAWHRSISGLIAAALAKERVLRVLRAWEAWSLFPGEYCAHLETLFRGQASARKSVSAPGLGSPNLSAAASADDLDGEPMDLADPTADRMAARGDERKEDEEDIDGEPMDLGNGPD